MSNAIIDVAVVTETVTLGPSATETAVVISAPTKTGSITRVILQCPNTQDCSLTVRRGSGVTGSALSSGFAVGGGGIVMLVDTTPAAQYTVTSAGDGSQTGPATITLSVDQIA